MASQLATSVTGTGPRLALIHGFTQTSRTWGAFGAALARAHQLVLVDAPGHGGSSAIEADVPEGAAMIGEAVGRASYLGYSMGGRHALRLAVDRPDLVEQLVLLGASPGMSDAVERRARAEWDDETARRLEQIGLDAFLEEWLAQPLFASLPGDASQVNARRANTVKGLASSLRRAGTGHQEPLWDRLASLTMPVLLVTGEDDVHFGAISKRMAEAIGANATTHAIAGAGHAVHLERPDDTARVVVDWLADA